MKKIIDYVVKCPVYINYGEVDYKTYHVKANYDSKDKSIVYMHPVYDVPVREKYVILEELKNEKRKQKK